MAIGWRTITWGILFLMNDHRFAQCGFAKENCRLAIDADPDDVRAEKEGEGPVDDDPKLTGQAGHLHQVVSATYKPRREPAHPDFEKLAEALAVAKGTHHSQCGVDKRTG